MIYSSSHFELVGEPSAYVLVLLFLIGLFTGLAWYAFNAFCQLLLLKAAKHRFPLAAWVPYWNSVTLLELAGIRGAWAFLGVLYFGFAVILIFPLNGILVLVGIPVAGMLLVTNVWSAMAIQKATGLESALGILLSILLPPVWYLWMSIRIGRTGYHREKAFEVGADYPFWWFSKLSDPRNAFHTEVTSEDLPTGSNQPE